MRTARTVEYIRHNFSQEETIALGAQLAESYEKIDSIENEEAVIKAQIKERKAQIQQDIGKLSRNITSGFEMQNVPCKWVYDSPNVGEVQYVRDDTGEVVKTRAMTHAELQQEIPFDEPVAVNPQTTEETEEAVEEFFAGEETSATITAETVEAIDALMVDAEPEEARQTLLTMGDAKKGRKKAPEANA